MTVVNLHTASLGIIMSITVIIILAASVVSVVLTEFGNIGIAHGQGNSATSLSLTPQQKAAICDPSNPKLKFVNSTESKICGIPSTPTNTTSSAGNTTTATEAPSSIPST